MFWSLWENMIMNHYFTYLYIYLLPNLIQKVLIFCPCNHFPWCIWRRRCYTWMFLRVLGLIMWCGVKKWAKCYHFSISAIIDNFLLIISPQHLSYGIFLLQEHFTSSLWVKIYITHTKQHYIIDFCVIFIVFSTL